MLSPRDRILLSLEFDDLLAAACAWVSEATGVAACEAHLVVVPPEAPEVRLRSGIVAGRPVSEPSGPPRHDLAEHGLALAKALYLESGVAEYAMQHKLLPPAISPVRAWLLPVAGRYRASLCLFLPASGSLPASLDQRLDELTEAITAVLALCVSFELVRRERNELQEIFEAATHLQAGDTSASLAQTACELMVERLKFDRALVALHDRDALDLIGVGSVGCDNIHTALRLPLPDHPGMLTQVFLHASAQWHAEIGGDSPLAEATGDRRRRYHAICLPLMIGGRCIGALYGDHERNHAQVTPNRFVSLQLFANSLAASIESTELLAQVGRLAEQDGLTGLANRRTFDATLHREVLRASRYGLHLSLLMIDVDKFKELNDTYGHPVGDEVLVATANLLRECIRETDLVARYGGDEFAVLMPSTDVRQANLVRDRVLSSMATLNRTLSRANWSYRLSLGLRSAEAEATEQLLESADKALYAHKETKVRKTLLEKLVSTPVEELHNWDHYLGKMLRVLYEKEPSYHPHGLRTMNLAVGLSRRVGVPGEEIEAIALAALLHDVGKISIPGAILSRPGPLSPKEYRLVMSHPKIGVDLLREINYLGEVCEIVGAHHERWDGETDCEFPAYPGEVSGADIPRGARILKLADSYDAMTCSRPYSPPLIPATASKIIREQAGRAFDPELALEFLGMLDDASKRPIQLLGGAGR